MKLSPMCEFVSDNRAVTAAEELRQSRRPDRLSTLKTGATSLERLYMCIDNLYAYPLALVLF
jgi:hypothetical protein